jgi:hypothetical protein
MGIVFAKMLSFELPFTSLKNDDNEIFNDILDQIFFILGSPSLGNAPSLFTSKRYEEYKKSSLLGN